MVQLRVSAGVLSGLILKVKIPPLRMGPLIGRSVIIQVPTPTTVKVEPLMVAIEASEEEYVNAPELSEVGGINSKGRLPICFGGTLKAPSVGGKGFTSSVVQEDINSTNASVYRIKNIGKI